MAFEELIIELFYGEMQRAPPTRRRRAFDARADFTNHCTCTCICTWSWRWSVEMELEHGAPRVH